MSENGICQRDAKVVPHDFQCPTPLGREQLEALRTLHEGFGRNASAGLSAMLRGKVELKPRSVEELAYGQFIVRLENPTCFNVLTAQPLEGNLILEIHPAILHPMIDRLLGGGRQRSPTTRRPLTEIELRLVSRINELLLRELGAAWKDVLALDPKVERVQSNPQLAQVVPPNERVVLIRFDVSLDRARGTLNLAIPTSVIERTRGRLSGETEAEQALGDVAPESMEQLSRRLRSAVVQLEVCLAQTRITTGELLGLRVGDVITTEQDAGNPITVSVEGVPKFQAAAGAHEGHKAIRIDEIVDDRRKSCS
ncbi:MAG: flagellar motor switch protein FliM [Planctomycetes bacterium]|nr:flagellar motor switch protein FliM [Planctomycetota bacterium]